MILYPPNPNQNPTQYPQVRTRINLGNINQFANIVETVLHHPDTEILHNIKIRGIDGTRYITHLYDHIHGSESGFFVGRHNEGEFEGQVKKAQPLSTNQETFLRNENRID